MLHERNEGVGLRLVHARVPDHQRARLVQALRHGLTQLQHLGRLAVAGVQEGVQIEDFEGEGIAPAIGGGVDHLRHLVALV